MEISLFDVIFEVSSEIKEGNKTVKILPSPEEQQEFDIASRVLDINSLNLLRSKHFFGIRSRTQMFEVLYNTFVELMDNQKDLNDVITAQTLFCEMIIKLGTMLEELAGICSACKEYSLHGTSIAEVYLAFSDPISFFERLLSKSGNRVIMQVFRLPESKGNLNKIFKDLSVEEIEVLWKGVQTTVQLVREHLEVIAKAIVREKTSNMTLYDMYNKLKHGYAPIYGFLLPIPIEIASNDENSSEENLIRQVILESVTFMHDKLPGQRTKDEQNKFNSGLATPAMTRVPVDKKLAEDMLNMVKSIEFLQTKLIETYLAYSQGSKRFLLLGRNDCITKDEAKEIGQIIDDKDRYL